MNERLRQFLLEVSQDPDRAKRLSANPSAELEQSDLSTEERDLVLSRNLDAILPQIESAAGEVILQLNSFFEKQAPTKPVRPRRKPSKKPRKPTRKPRKKAPAAKKPARKRPTVRKPGSRKSPRKRSRRPPPKGTRRRG